MNKKKTNKIKEFILKNTRISVLILIALIMLISATTAYYYSQYTYDLEEVNEDDIVPWQTVVFDLMGEGPVDTENSKIQWMGNISSSCIPEKFAPGSANMAAVMVAATVGSTYTFKVDDSNYKFEIQKSDFETAEEKAELKADLLSIGLDMVAIDEMVDSDETTTIDLTSMFRRHFFTMGASMSGMPSVLQGQSPESEGISIDKETGEVNIVDKDVIIDKGRALLEDQVAYMIDSEMKIEKNTSVEDVLNQIHTRYSVAPVSEEDTYMTCFPMGAISTELQPDLAEGQTQVTDDTVYMDMVMLQEMWLYDVLYYVMYAYEKSQTPGMEQCLTAEEKWLLEKIVGVDSEENIAEEDKVRFERLITYWDYEDNFIKKYADYIQGGYEIDVDVVQKNPSK